jgi:hypothetical protein
MEAMISGLDARVAMVSTWAVAAGRENARGRGALAARVLLSSPVAFGWSQRMQAGAARLNFGADARVPNLRRQCV